jgi:CRP-like cAMP-binding protein
LTTFDELRRIPLFEDLPDDALLEVAGQGLEKFVPAGEVTGREGEPVEHLSDIHEGDLRNTK